MWKESMPPVIDHCLHHCSSVSDPHWTNGIWSQACLSHWTRRSSRAGSILYLCVHSAQHRTWLGLFDAYSISICLTGLNYGSENLTCYSVAATNPMFTDQTQNSHFQHLTLKQDTSIFILVPMFWSQSIVDMIIKNVLDTTEISVVHYLCSLSASVQR